MPSKVKSILRFLGSAFQQKSLAYPNRRCRLACEPLETRVLLDADLMASIAGVVFNDVDDNGVFEAGIDMPLEGVTVTLTKESDAGFLETDTSEADGAYRFDGLGAGVYFVTQDPVDGLFQRPGMTQQTVIKSVDDATGLSGTTIDAFETFVAVSATAGNTPDFDFVQTSVTEVIGGERELSANLISETGQIDLIVNPSGSHPVLQFDSAAASSAERSVVWDGDADNGSPGVDFGLNADLTSGGADALIVRVPFDDLPIDITIRIYADDSNYSDATISLPGGIFAMPEAFVVPFDQFTETDSGADFENVTAIELFHDPGAPAVDVQIDYIGTIGPMLVDFPNLELGVHIEKSTNGEDADLPTGPVLPIGDKVGFIYVVENTGNVPLTITDIVDDNGTPADETDDFSPTPVGVLEINIGDTNENRLLDVDESWLYMASRFVTAGQHTNIAKVVAEDLEDAGTVMDVDPSNHLGAVPGVQIEKSTNGEDADTPTGPLVPVDELVQFVYEVSNTGNVPLTITDVTDNHGTPGDPGDDFSPAPVEVDGFNVGDDNQDGLLGETETWVYEADRLAVAGQYANIGRVTAFDELEQEVNDVDESHYFGVESGIHIEKSTNGEDADTPTGPLVPAGELVQFIYEVRNTGNMPLIIQEVTDNNGTPGDPGDDFAPSPVEMDGFNVGDDNQDGLLDETEEWIYEADRFAITGQYANIGQVSALDVLEQEVNDVDESHYFGVEPGVQIEKSTNGEDADTPTGPLVPVGEMVQFVYEVSNTGNVPIAITSVMDNNGTPGDPGDDFSPTPVEIDDFNVGDLNQNRQLDETETWVFEADRLATAGQYANIGTVLALDSLRQEVTDVDSSHYLGVEPGVQIEKSTNGEDADTPTGPLVPVDELVQFVYEVSNTGNMPLTIQEVMDNNGTPGDPGDDFSPAPVEVDGFNVGDDNQNGLLDETETWVYEADRLAVAGQYANIGRVTAFGELEQEVNDVDESHYFGVESGIHIEKSTNGEDADAPTGPLVPVDELVQFVYEVRNTGNMPLTILEVMDNNGTPGDAGDDFAPSPVEMDGFNVGDLNQDGLLDEIEEWIYEADRFAIAGQYANIGRVSALDVLEQEVNDVDESHYFGVESSIHIEKSTNGEDADTPTGPLVPVGELVQFVYEVRNTGNVPLLITSVMDNNGTPGDPGDDFSPSPVEMDGFNVGDLNQDGLLDEIEEWIYEADRFATTGQYANIGTVVALDTLEQEVMDADESHYLGIDRDPRILIEKSTNGEDADTPTGPLVVVGEDVLFTYEVRNAGNVPLTIASVMDNNGTPGDPGDDFAPSPVEVDGFNVGDVNRNDQLDETEEWRYTASRTATAGQYTNIGTVIAFDRLEQEVTDADPSHHFGVRRDFIVIGNDKGTESRPLVTVLDPVTGEEVAQFLAYDEDYRGGVRIATGDMDGDGVDEIITAPGKSHLPEIRVFSRVSIGDPGEWEELPEFRTLAYATDFVGGVQIAVGDVDGDGRNDIVTTPTRGAVETKVFRNTFGVEEDPIENDPYRQFFAFGPTFISGSVVSLADMNSDGLPDVVVGNSGGMRSTVLVFDVSDSPSIIQSFFPFDESARGGVSIDLGDINGDGVPDLIAAAGYRGESAVEVFDGDSGELLTNFTAYDGSSRNAPVRVAARDTDGDGQVDRIMTAQGPNGETNRIRGFDLIFGDDDELTAVLNPLATLDLDELLDPFLLGAYFIDLLD